MSVTSGFFNSINGDRKYNAEQMSSIFDGIINDGVFANIGTAFSVQATTGNTVNVGTGRCWFDSTWLLNDATLPIELDDAEVLLDRIDAIVIEINHSESIRAGSIKVVNGTPSSTPANPTMTHTDYINQYPIAYIMRSANTNAITQANITYTVGSDNCPFITGILSVVSIQNIVAQWENEFDTWLDGLSAMLDDNTAANLANQILELKEQFDTLAKEKKIYSELEDSTGEDTIDDSSGSPILGTTAMYSDEGLQESIPGVVASGDPYKVGDTLTTARTDLGAKWLLCNGDILDRDLYPELANLFPTASDITGEWNEENFWTTTKMYDTGIQTIAYLNGYYVVGGQKCEYTNSPYPNYATIAYSTSLEGPWTEKDLWGFSQKHNGRNYLYQLFFENGKYYAMGGDDTVSSPPDSKGSYAPIVAYATDLSGSWTKIYPTGFSSSDDTSFIQLFESMIFDGQRYVSPYDSYKQTDSSYGDRVGYYRIKLSYTDNIESSSWTSIKIDESSVKISDSVYACGHEPTCMAYLNGYYIIGAARYGDFDDPGNTKNSKSFLYYSQNVSGPYTKVELQTLPGVSMDGYVVAILYVNDQYVVFANADDAVKVFTSDTLSGSWTSQVLNFPSNKESAPYLYDAIYKDGKYTIVTSRNVYQSESLNGPWMTWPIDGRTASIGLRTVVDINGTIVAGGRDTDPSISKSQRAKIWSSSTGEISLPSISLSDKTYTYIRAKE